MKTIYKIWYQVAALSVCLLLLSGCENLDGYLDKAETGGLTEEELFSDYTQTERFMANIYSNLYTDWMPVNSFTYAAASDEAKCPVTYFSGPQNFTRGLISPGNNPVDNWASLYASVRKTNLFLANIDNLPTINPTQVTGKARLKAEAYFLRAWFYAELFKRYGGVPLIDRVLQINDDLNIPRNSVDEVVAFIVQDCERAESLPTVHTSNNIGRATKGAAMMLKARVLLYAASPLHNTQNSIDKWEKAATAANAVKELGIYSVDTDYSGLFHKRNTSSIIFQSTFNNTDWLRRIFVPSQSGNGLIQPLQNLVDDYEMKNGKMITETGSGYDPANPYVDRDPRFEKSIIYNGRNWKGTPIATYVGGSDGLVSAEGYLTQTGYYLAKTVDENGSVSPDNRPGDHYWIFMRYEETLLNYAEAKNEALATPDQSVYDAVNAVRTRAGINMPALATGLTKAQMRERIRHERRIELAFEAHRFWDIRRWKIGDQVMTKAYGMRVTRQGDGTLGYEKFLVEDRIHNTSSDLFPIPQSEMNKNNKLDQNPGYTR